MSIMILWGIYGNSESLSISQVYGQCKCGSRIESMLKNPCFLNVIDSYQPGKDEMSSLHVSLGIILCQWQYWKNIFLFWTTGLGKSKVIYEYAPENYPSTLLAIYQFLSMDQEVLQRAESMFWPAYLLNILKPLRRQVMG